MEENIASTDTMLCMDNAGTAQLLQDLCQELRGEVVNVGNLPNGTHPAPAG